MNALMDSGWVLLLRHLSPALTWTTTAAGCIVTSNTQKTLGHTLPACQWHGSCSPYFTWTTALRLARCGVRRAWLVLLKPYGPAMSRPRWRHVDRNWSSYTALSALNPSQSTPTTSGSHRLLPTFNFANASRPRQNLQNASSTLKASTNAATWLPFYGGKWRSSRIRARTTSGRLSKPSSARLWSASWSVGIPGILASPRPTFPSLTATLLPTAFGYWGKVLKSHAPLAKLGEFQIYPRIRGWPFLGSSLSRPFSIGSLRNCHVKSTILHKEHYRVRALTVNPTDNLDARGRCTASMTFLAC